MGAPYPLFTGDILRPFDGGWDTKGRLTVIQDKPMPFTLVAVMPEVDIS